MSIIQDLKIKAFLELMHFDNEPVLLEPAGDIVIVTWMYDEKANRTIENEKASSGIQKWFKWDGTLLRICDMFLEFGMTICH